MILNTADNIMYGDKEVQKVFYGKYLVWERNSFYWISNRQEQTVCGYSGVPTSPICYLNWNQEPKNVSRPFPSNDLKCPSVYFEDKYKNVNIFKDDIGFELYKTYNGYYNVKIYDTSMCTFNPYRSLFKSIKLYINYNQLENKSYCDSIGEDAFLFGAVDELILSNCKLKSVGDSAFAHFRSNGSNTLIFGDDETDSCIIERQAFWESNWDLKVIFDCSNVKLSNYIFTNSKVSEIIFEKDVSALAITDNTFEGCENLSKVVLPNGITSIGNNVFYGCYNLKEINLPYGITSIGDYAFYDCDSLTSITIPDSVIEIGSYAFAWCENIEKVDLPNKMSHIKECIFRGCENLLNVTMPNNTIIIENEAFHSCTSLESIIIPNSVTSIGYKAFAGCINITNITIPNSVTNIGEGAFSGMGLSSITLPNKLQTIESNTFHNTKLESVRIPVSVKTIKTNAFGEAYNIYYEGTKEQWGLINKEDGWVSSTHTIHFNS